MPDGMMGMGAKAMQGLSSAAPAAPEMAAPAAGPEQAMQILQDAVSQYGPEIIEILKQILAGAGAGPAGGDMGGMM